jgi:hypothetical protein
MVTTILTNIMKSLTSFGANSQATNLKEKSIKQLLIFRDNIEAIRQPKSLITRKRTQMIHGDWSDN